VSRKKKKRNKKQKRNKKPGIIRVGAKSPLVNGDLTCPPNIYWEMSSWLAAEALNEITGFGVVRDAEIVRAYKTTTAMEQAMADGFDTINLQWHTHPGMGAFWSSTDLGAHKSMLSDALDLSNSGSMHFLVYDFGDWLHRKYEWTNRNIIYAEEAMKIGSGEVKLDGRVSDPIYAGTHYTGHSYKTYHYNDECALSNTCLAFVANTAGECLKSHTCAHHREKTWSEPCVHQGNCVSFMDIDGVCRTAGWCSAYATDSLDNDVARLVEAYDSGDTPTVQEIAEYLCRGDLAILNGNGRQDIAASVEELWISGKPIVF